MSKSKRARSQAKSGRAKRDKEVTTAAAKLKSPLKAALKAVPKKHRPKGKCCNSRPRCRRCPLLMLKHGTLPAGLAVQHRRLVVAPEHD